EFQSCHSGGRQDGRCEQGRENRRRKEVTLIWVLTQPFPSAGVANFAINAYDILENLVATRDELGKTNTFVYGPLNRLKTQVLPDGAAINLAYNSKGSLTNRVMPGGLTWSATFDNANRTLSEQLVGGTTTNHPHRNPGVERVTKGVRDEWHLV